MESEKHSYQDDLIDSIRFAKEEIEEARRICNTSVELTRLKYSEPNIQKDRISALRDEGYRVDEEDFFCRWNQI